MDTKLQEGKFWLDFRKKKNHSGQFSESEHIEKLENFYSLKYIYISIKRKTFKC